MDKTRARGTLLRILAAVILVAAAVCIGRSCGTGGIPVPAGEKTGGRSGETAEAEVPALAPGSGSLPLQDDTANAGAVSETGNTADPEEVPGEESSQEETGAAMRQGIRGIAKGAPGGAPSSAAEETDPPGSASSAEAYPPGTAPDDVTPSGTAPGAATPSGTAPGAAEPHRHVRAVRQVLVREAYDEEVTDVPAWDESVIVQEAYDEPVYGQVSFAVCNTCGQAFPTADALFAHQAATMQGTEGEDGMHGGYHVAWEEQIISYIHHEAVWGTVHHDAVTHTEHHPAEYRDETYCSVCGMILKEGG